MIIYSAATSAGKLHLKRTELISLIFAMLVLMYSAIRSLADSWSYVIFIIWPLVPLIFRSKIRAYWLDVILFELWVIQLWIISANGFDLVSLAEESATTETDTIPGIAGLLVGVYLILGKRTLAFLSFLLVLVSAKRIVLLATIAGLAFMIFAKYLYKRDDQKNSWYRLIIYSALMAFMFSVAIYLPFIFQEIGERFDVSANAFSMGRLEGQEIAYEALRRSSWLKLLLGHGLGQVDIYASMAWGRDNLIHNDYLRMLIDLGIVGTSIFLSAYLRLIGAGRFGFYIVGYTATTWLTSNILIYAFYGFAVCLVVLVGRNEACRNATGMAVGGRRSLVPLQRPAGARRSAPLRS